MPNYTAADGVSLAASVYNANVRDQVITTCTSATRPAGTEGQFIYETDTDLIYVYNGTVWTQFGSNSAWTNYTPNLSQSGSLTFTGTGRHFKIGRCCVVNMRLDVTSAGVATNPVIITMPFTANAGSEIPCGTGWVYDSSTVTIYQGISVSNTTANFKLFDTTQATGVVHLGQTGTAFALALASGDAVGLHAVYETAA